MLFWDSDVSDVNEHTRNSKDKNKIRSAYLSDLKNVTQRVLDYGAFFAFGGPAILGESGFYVRHDFVYKDGMLNDYRRMNQNVALEYNVTYVDIRHAYMKVLPFYHWMYSFGFVTVDGEHANERGAQIVANNFGDALRPWLKSVST